MTSTSPPSPARPPVKPPTKPAEKAAAEVPPPKAEGPRYQQISGMLQRAIVDGTYPIGARLPTEAELCAEFRISRFTAREAIRVLHSAGLVTRRPRVGTVVIARPDTARYAQEASSLPDLLQYARDTELRFVYVGKVTLSAEQARDFGAAAGEEWTYALGVRSATKPPVKGQPLTATRPICITRLFLNPALKEAGALLRKHKLAVYSLIEREYGLRIHRVEQELVGAVLDADDAANLGCEAGAPALRIVRRYFDKQDRMLELADNIHPSDRFSYRMQMRR